MKEVLNVREVARFDRILYSSKGVAEAGLCQMYIAEELWCSNAPVLVCFRINV